MDMDWHTQTDAHSGFGHSRNLGWTGYTWNKRLIPDAAGLLGEFKRDGISVVLNDHPCDGMREHEENYPIFMQKLPPGTPENPPFNAGDPRYMDAFFASAHEPLEKQGVDFWWLDWQQNYIYPNVIGVPYLEHLPWLNFLYYRNSEKNGRRGASFSRWGGWGITGILSNSRATRSAHGPCSRSKFPSPPFPVTPVAFSGRTILVGLRERGIPKCLPGGCSLARCLRRYGSIR